MDIVALGYEGDVEGQKVTVRPLHYGGVRNPELDHEKHLERFGLLWGNMAQHKHIFGDIHDTNIQDFIAMYSDPRSLWLEVIEEDETLAGVMYMTDIIPMFDGQGHFAFFGKNTHKYESVIRAGMLNVMQQIPLHRITVSVPVFHYGLKRIIERLGFQLEGTRRETNREKDRWVDSLMFGMVITDLIQEGEENGRPE